MTTVDLRVPASLTGFADVTDVFASWTRQLGASRASLKNCYCASFHRAPLPQTAFLQHLPNTFACACLSEWRRKCCRLCSLLFCWLCLQTSTPTLMPSARMSWCVILSMRQATSCLHKRHLPAMHASFVCDSSLSSLTHVHRGVQGGEDVFWGPRSLLGVPVRTAASFNLPL